MLVQNLTRWGNIQAIGWGTCPKMAWEMMALRSLKGALSFYLKRQTDDPGIGVKTDDPGGGPGVNGVYTNHIPGYNRISPPGLPEYDGAEWEKVNKALRKEVKALIKKALKTL